MVPAGPRRAGTDGVAFAARSTTRPRSFASMLSIAKAAPGRIAALNTTMMRRIVTALAIASAAALSTTTAPRPRSYSMQRRETTMSCCARREARRRSARRYGSCARRAATWPTSASTAIKFLSDSAARIPRSPPNCPCSAGAPSASTASSCSRTFSRSYQLLVWSSTSSREKVPKSRTRLEAPSAWPSSRPTRRSSILPRNCRLWPKL